MGRPLGGLTYPLWGWAIPKGPDNRTCPSCSGSESAYTAKVVFYLVIGVFFALTLPLVVRASPAVPLVPSRLLLSGGRAQQQVGRLTEGRDAGRGRRGDALRRLERDIHDGPQQRLVRLAMDLGRARKQAGDATPTPPGTVDEALRQARETLDELRALSRGIAPPVLADRGPAAPRSRRWRPARPSRSTSTSTCPASRLAAARREHRVLRGRRGADQRGQAQRRHRRAGLGRRWSATAARSGSPTTAAAARTCRKGHGLAGLADRVRAAGGAL